MRAFCTITIEIFSFITVLLHRRGKHLLGLVDLHPDLRQVGQFERGAVFIDQCLKIEPVKLKVMVLDIETFLREVERLLHQVGVRVVLLCLIQFV